MAVCTVYIGIAVSRQSYHCQHTLFILHCSRVSATKLLLVMLVVTFVVTQTYAFGFRFRRSWKRVVRVAKKPIKLITKPIKAITSHKGSSKHLFIFYPLYIVICS